jgi:hypothetical protein
MNEDNVEASEKAEARQGGQGGAAEPIDARLGGYRGRKTRGVSEIGLRADANSPGTRERILRKRCGCAPDRKRKSSF